MDAKLLYLTRLFHILVLGPLLLYVGIEHPSSAWIYIMLAVLGSLAILAFGLQASTKDAFWVVWHMLIIGVLLLSMAVLRTQSPEYLFRLCIIVGSAAIGYHAIRLIQEH